jgi:hypothetical protein
MAGYAALGLLMWSLLSCVQLARGLLGGFGSGMLPQAPQIPHLLAIGPPPAIAASMPLKLEEEVTKLDRQSQMVKKLEEEASGAKKRGEKKAALPFVNKKADLELRSVASPALQKAIVKVQALAPYVDEVERLVSTRQWGPLQGFLGLFSEQEEDFVNCIDGIYPRSTPADESSRAAMQYEAQRIFLSVDDLNQAAKLKRESSAQKAYVRLALAYDRFLKAGGILLRYDTLTSTEPLYMNVPDEALIYDTRNEPDLRDPILVISGPDKGRTGRLIGIVKSRGEGVIKLDAINDVKLVNMSTVAKQLGSIQKGK